MSLEKMQARGYQLINLIETASAELQELNKAIKNWKEPSDGTIEVDQSGSVHEEQR